MSKNTSYRLIGDLNSVLLSLQQIYYWMPDDLKDQVW